MTDKSAGFGVLALLFYYVIAAALPMLFALWLLWRHPPQRRKAAVILLLPLLAVFLPSVIQGIVGGPVAPAHVAGLMVLLAIGVALASIVAPRRIATTLPAFLFRSRTVNGFIVAGLVFAWVLLAIGILWVLSDAPSGGYRRDTGTGLAYALILLMMYVLSVAAASLSAVVWASLGLRSDIDGACRKLFVTQWLVAAPGILAGLAACAFWLVQR
ncbi:hypothetical protein BA177_17045 [Woeseia oceani]|uniref:Uncharacterized protein n=2 Tax=Woeseia oceani TaxID=1548547 RepID=A0A193LJN2_9GAMM|nr:hypothetical protein BA177_17045 [Woeseia oceani]